MRAWGRAETVVACLLFCHIDYGAGFSMKHIEHGKAWSLAHDESAGITHPELRASEIPSSVRRHKSMDINRLGLRMTFPPSEEQLASATARASVPEEPRLYCSTDHTKREGESEANGRCDYLGKDFRGQLDHVLRANKHKRPIAWTVLDQSYAWIARDQEAQLSDAGFNLTLFVAIEPKEAFSKELCEAGLTIIDFSKELGSLQNSSGTHIPWTLKHRVARAKFTMPGLLHAHGVDNLFTEMDVFWLQNPLPEFQARVPGGAAPSFVFSTHTDNPFAINIGVWYARGDAPPGATDFFDTCARIMASYATSENSNSPYEMFDQQVLESIIRKRTNVVGTMWARDDEDDALCNESRFLWCREVNMLARSDIVVRKLHNFRIASETVPEYDESVLAVHILGSTPLRSARQKIWLAKLDKVFIGLPQYYERDTSSNRYIAWDGFIKSSTFSNGYGRGPDSVTKMALPILLGLGTANGRVVILPKVLDRYGHLWNSEQLFDVAAYGTCYNDNECVEIRESSFLYNDRLVATRMFPVAQVTVTPFSWASIRFTPAFDAPSQVTYFKIDSLPVENANAKGVALRSLVSIMDDEQVKTAKTVLVDLPLKQTGQDFKEAIIKEASCAANIRATTDQDRFCARDMDLVPSSLRVGDICAH